MLDRTLNIAELPFACKYTQQSLHMHSELLMMSSSELDPVTCRCCEVPVAVQQGADGLGHQQARPHNSAAASGGDVSAACGGQGRPGAACLGHLLHHVDLQAQVRHSTGLLLSRTLRRLALWKLPETGPALALLASYHMLWHCFRARDSGPSADHAQEKPA